MKQVAPLKTLPPPPPKANETSGTVSGANPTSLPLPAGLKPRLPDNRPELVPYISEYFRLMSKKDLKEFDGSTLGELVGAMQFSAFHLSCMATYYKAKVGRYDRRMKEDIQSAKSKADAAEKKAGDLNLENIKLIEKSPSRRQRLSLLRKS